MDTNGPDYEAEAKGSFTSGLTEAEPSYRSQFVDRRGHCELKTVDIDMKLVVTLPRHATPRALSDQQLSRWNAFKDGVAVHEQEHVDIHIIRIEAFKKRLEGFPERFSDCDSLKSSLTSAWEIELALNKEEQEAFHQAEEQMSQRLRAPVRTQIAENESELDQLQAKLDSQSSKIAALKLGIDDAERSAQPFKAQMDAIQDRYPDLVLPPDIFKEYERLRTEWSRLNDLRNRIVDEVNGLVQQSNRTAEEFNLLTDYTNQLFDELAWLP